MIGIGKKERITNVFQVKRRAGKIIEPISIFYKNQPTYNQQRTKHLGKLVSNSPLGNHSKTSALNELKVTPYVDDGYRCATQLLSFNRDLDKLHETQKPVELIEFLIKTYTNENETVLDFTMGSGTSGVACVNTNRKFIGVELDKDYYELSIKRIKQALEKEGV